MRPIIAATLNDLNELNDLELCNSPLFCVILPNPIAFHTDYVKMVEARPIMSAEYHLPKLINLHFNPSAIAELLVFNVTRCRSNG